MFTPYSVKCFTQRTGLPKANLLAGTPYILFSRYWCLGLFHVRETRTEKLRFFAVQITATLLLELVYQFLVLVHTVFWRILAHPLALEI